jgi:hypothetical protein
MKKIFFFLLILLSSGLLYPQNDNSQSSLVKSKVIPPPNFNPSSTNGTVYTTPDGFDNFYLGTDFGETNIAVNPTDPKNQICAYNMNSFYYTLNGIDWIRSYPAFSGYPTTGDPVVTFDGLGNVYYLQMYEITSAVMGNVVAKSTNKGVSWISYTNAFQANANDKPWIIADQTGGPYANNIYVGQWQPSSGMKFTRSTDGGVSYSSPISLAGNQGAYVSIGPNGAVNGGYVYFACIISNSIALYRSGDGGASFTSMGYAASSIVGPGTPYGIYGRYSMKDAHIRTDIFPRMAVDNSNSPYRGYIYITYAANPPGPDLADIFLVRSTNYGSSWSTPIRVNDDLTTYDQWMPCINTDKTTGKVFLSWYDSRSDPANVMTEVYGTTSTDGGATFTPNTKISNASFNPNTMAEPQNTGDSYYMGDYIGNASTGNSVTSVTSWMDDRVNTPQTMQSFVGYNPDFALKLNTTQRFVGNNDSTTVTIIVPAIKGIYNDKVKFTAALDTLPTTGSINFSFVNGKDTISSFPDSVYLKIKTVGIVTPQRSYQVTITGTGSNGTPAHKRTLSLLANANVLTVQSNRNGTCNFKVNGATFNNITQFIFPIGTIVNVQAISPQGTSGTRYIFQNWSDNGDTTHNITITGALNLTCNYKPQYKLTLLSAYGNTVGQNQYFDSAATFTFGVYPRIVRLGGGVGYQFRGWTGSGIGSYTSPDSTGLDTMRTLAMSNPVVEVARWTFVPVSVNNISSEIPDKFLLHQNYPNPFNPSTNIKFDVAKTGLVSIKIYDVLGREVVTLVNEILQPGYYSIPFSINDLTGFQASSGIYFYKISANDFTDIKKMLIIK